MDIAPRKATASLRVPGNRWLGGIAGFGGEDDERRTQSDRRMQRSGQIIATSHEFSPQMVV